MVTFLPCCLKYNFSYLRRFLLWLSRGLGLNCVLGFVGSWSATAVILFLSLCPSVCPSFRLSVSFIHWCLSNYREISSLSSVFGSGSAFKAPTPHPDFKEIVLLYKSGPFLTYCEDVGNDYSRLMGGALHYWSRTSCLLVCCSMLMALSLHSGLDLNWNLALCH